MSAFESMQGIVNQVLGPAVEALEKLSFIGEMSHIVKLEAVVST